MNFTNVAVELVNYYDLTQGVGHTKAMLTGAEDTEGVIILAETHSIAERLAVNCTKAIPMGLGGCLMGRRKPLLIDNSALKSLLSGLLEEISRLKKMSEKEN